MSEHELVRDLLAPVALGVADDPENARVEAHLSECPLCREELSGLRAGADALALAVPQAEPSPALRQRLMETVNEEAGRMAAARQVVGAPADAPRRCFRLAALVPRAWAVAAVAASAAMLLLGWNLALQTRSDPAPKDEVARVAVQGTDAAPGVRGNVTVLASEDTAVLRLRGLPPLSAAQAYEVWVIRDGVPRSAGFLEPTGPNEGTAVATGLDGPSSLAVTAELRTNRAAPTSEPLVNVPLPQLG